MTTPSGLEHIRPTYYQQGIEPIEIIRSWKLNFNLGNALKYILRPGKAKTVASRIEDLRKAQTYLAFEIAELAQEQEERHKEEV